MGFFGELIDDIISAPAQIIGGIAGMTAGAIAETLKLPIAVVEAAISAGCETAEEIESWAKKYM